MADLEEVGLLHAPHISAGRLPTEAGLRLFVHGLLQVGNLTENERETIQGRAAAAGRSLPEMLGEATAVLSGLSGCTGLVVAPKTDRPLKHLEFVNLGPGRTLIVMVTDDGVVENRVIETPLGIPAASLVMASNYLSSRLIGRTIDEGRAAILAEIQSAPRPTRRADREPGRGRARHPLDRHRPADRARPEQSARGCRRPGRCAAHPRALRGAGNQGHDAEAAGGREQSRRGCRYSSARKTNCSPMRAVR